MRLNGQEDEFPSRLPYFLVGIDFPGSGRQILQRGHRLPWLIERLLLRDPGSDVGHP